MNIGIDHGYYAIKTRHCSFPAGLTTYGSHEPYTRQGLLESGRCFFVCGTGRQPIQRDKTINDNYYLLTMAALAQEIRSRGAPTECTVRIAAGLPLTSYGRDKPKFRSYLLCPSQPVQFRYEGVEYSITIADVQLFPQGFAALMAEPDLLTDEPSLLLMDIGGWTVDLMRIDNALPVAETAHCLELGMIRCIDEIRERVRQETGLSLTDAQIEQMLAGQPCSLSDEVRNIVNKQGHLYEQGNHIYDENGNAKLVIMTDTTNPLLPKDVDTFYTDDTGMLVLPEKLPLGHYRLVEVNAPNGFYNEWVASAVYEDGHLQIDDTGNFADGSFYVDFSVTTDRAYKANGDDNENSQDILVIDEDYQNNETLGVLKIRKTGEVLTGWQEDEGDTFDPEFSGEARPGYFVYEERPIPYAEYTITANEDIYTQDRQTDANGNRTLWYAKGDVVAVVRTGDGTSDIAAFAPGRTNSTYDFLSVIHDGTVGEVIITLPLGSYHVEETTAPYGFVGTKQSYDVTFVWDKQTNDVVLAKTITSNPGDGSASENKNYEIVNVKDASAAQIDAQVLKFHNERVKPQLDIYKQDIKTGALVAGAVYNLITVDDIYSATGDLLFRAGDLIATSAPTDENGHTTFTCDFPMRGEFYGMGGVRIPENTTANSGKYRIVELRPPQGYYLDAPDQVFEFVYQGAATPVIEMENTFENDATSFFVSKRKLTGDEELPGATLTIQDKDGNVVRQWVSGDTPTEIRGLKFDTVYTLVETAAPNGYELAESMRFKLIQRKDENGDLLNEADVYVCTGKDWLIFDHWTLLEDGMVVMRDAPSPDTPENPSSTPTPTPEQPASTPTPTPVTNLPQTGDIPWLPAVLLGTAVVAAMGLMLIRKWKHAGG